MPNDSAALRFINSAALRHASSGALSNGWMKTVEEVRRLRLLELRARYGSFAAINKALNRTATDSTLSQITNQSDGSKTKKPKTMGSLQARAIELALELEVGWMDTDPELLGAAPSWPFPGIEFSRFSRLEDAQKMEIQGALRNLILEYEKTKPGNGGSQGNDSALAA